MIDAYNNKSYFPETSKEAVINQMVVYCLLKTICIGSGLLFLHDERSSAL